MFLLVGHRAVAIVSQQLYTLKRIRVSTDEARGAKRTRHVGVTFRKMMSCFASPSGTSCSLREEGGTQRRLWGGTGVRPEARSTGPGCRALSVLSAGGPRAPPPHPPPASCVLSRPRSPPHESLHTRADNIFIIHSFTIHNFGVLYWKEREMTKWRHRLFI